MFQVCIETIEQDAGQNLPSDGNQGVAVVVITAIPVPFVLVEMDNESIPKSLVALLESTWS